MYKEAARDAGFRVSTADKALQQYLKLQNMSYEDLKSFSAAFCEIAGNLSIQLCDLGFCGPDAVHLVYYRKSARLDAIWADFTGTSALEERQEQERFLTALFGVHPFVPRVCELLFEHVARIHGIAADALFAEFLASSSLPSFAQFRPSCGSFPALHFVINMPKYSDFCAAAQLQQPVEPVRLLEKLSQFMLLRRFYIKRPGRDVRAAEFAQQKADLNGEVEMRLCKALKAKTYADAVDSMTANPALNEAILTLRRTGIKANGKFNGSKDALKAAYTIIDQSTASRIQILKITMGEAERALEEISAEMDDVDVRKSLLEWPMCHYKQKEVHFDFLRDMARMHSLIRVRAASKSCDSQTTWSRAADGALCCVE